MTGKHDRGRPLTGRGVLAIFIGAFGVIIAVNVLLAYNAVRTFPGLEVRNSYVASQSFDTERAAQQALGWTLSAKLAGDGRLSLGIRDRGGAPAAVASLSARIGRPTERTDDRDLDLIRVGDGYEARFAAGPGKWHLWVEATALDGTAFRQRLTLVVGGEGDGRG